MVDADAILTEVVVTRELSNLKNGRENMTTNFVELFRSWVVKGECNFAFGLFFIHSFLGTYPKELLDAFKRFAEVKDSLNTLPSKYSSTTRHYIAMALSLGGIDLENFEVKNEQCLLSIFFQILISLAVRFSFNMVYFFIVFLL